MTIQDYLDKNGLTDLAMPVLLASVPDDKAIEVLGIPVKDCRGTSRAGYWSPSTRSLHIHAALTGENRRETFLHELAHVIVWYSPSGYSVSSAHGFAWQSVMLKLGLAPNRCASQSKSQEIFASVTMRFLYRCSKCTETWKLANRRPSLLKPTVKHRKCGGQFTEESLVNFDTSPEAYWRAWEASL